MVKAEATVTRGISGTAVVVSGRVAAGVMSRSSILRVPLTITENGTYTAPMGTAYSPVIANVADSLPWASDEGGGF